MEKDENDDGARCSADGEISIEEGKKCSVEQDPNEEFTAASQPTEEKKAEDDNIPIPASSGDGTYAYSSVPDNEEENALDCTVVDIESAGKKENEVLKSEHSGISGNEFTDIAATAVAGGATSTHGGELYSAVPAQAEFMERDIEMAEVRVRGRSGSGSAHGNSQGEDSTVVVAEPVFFAEVAVWEVPPPVFEPYLGRRDPPSAEDAPPPPRDPVFTAEDKRNPLFCACKCIGIVLVLPFYVMFNLLIGTWCRQICKALDCVLLKPIGLLLDGVFFIFKWVFYALFHCLLKPVYMCCVPLSRMAKYCCKCSAGLCLGCVDCCLACMDWTCNGMVYIAEWACKTLFTVLYYGIWVPIGFVASTVYNYIILPSWKGTVLGCTFIWEYILVPVGSGIRYIAVYIYNAIVAACSFIYTYILVPIWNILTYIAVSIYNGIVALCSAIYKYVLTPIGHAVMFVGRAVYNGISALVSGIINGVVALGKCIYDYILKPIGNGAMFVARAAYNGISALVSGIASGVAAMGRCIYDYLLKPIGNGVVAVVSGFYNYLLVPMGNGIAYIFRAIINGVAAVGSGIYQYVIAPLGSAIAATFRAIYSGVLVPIGRLIAATAGAIGRAIAAVASAVGSVLASVGRAIGSIFSALGGSRR